MHGALGRIQLPFLGSIPRSAALDAVDVGCAVRRATCALAFPHHLAQAFHCFMVRIVQRIALGGQQLNSLPDAAWLVDRALLADGQVHRQVQKWIGFTAFNVVHLVKCRRCVRKIRVVFGMFGQPLACYGFKSFERLPRKGFGLH